MTDNYASWRGVRARGRDADPRTAADQAAGKAEARERREAYVRGHQLAEIRAAADVTQAELAGAMGCPRPASQRLSMARSPASTSYALMSLRWAGASKSSPRSATVAGKLPDSTTTGLVVGLS